MHFSCSSLPCEHWSLVSFAPHLPYVSRNLTGFPLFRILRLDRVVCWEHSKSSRNAQMHKRSAPSNTSNRTDTQGSARVCCSCYSCSLTRQSASFSLVWRFWVSENGIFRFVKLGFSTTNISKVFARSSSLHIAHIGRVHIGIALVRHSSVEKVLWNVLHVIGVHWRLRWETRECFLANRGHTSIKKKT